MGIGIWAEMVNECDQFKCRNHFADLIQDKEVDCGGAPPRVLGLDDYFMTEVEKVEKDPDTGRGVKTKVRI